jgi:hypothetical protein
MGKGDFISELIVIITNFVVYWTFHPQYQTDCYNAINAVFQGLSDDVFQPQFPLPEAYNWTLREQIEHRGFIYEEHEIITEDGYILTAFRVPGKRSEKKGEVLRQPVIMKHGLVDDGGTWFFNNSTLDLSL